MGELVVRVPVTALSEFRSLLLPILGEGARVELIVRTGSSGLALRDAAAYLRLIDHVYGRLHPGGLRSYAMRPAEHLLIDQVRSGSVELVVSEALQALRLAQPLAIVFLCLKFLPPALESVAKAYDSVQQGLLARANRKQIRSRMEKDEMLDALSKKRREELVALVEAVLARAQALVPRAFRFAEKHVIEVAVRVVKRDDPN